MSDPLRTVLRSHLAAGYQLVLCLDFDGTLAPKVAHPDAADLPATTVETLERLAASDTIEVAVISGRSLTDVRTRVGVEGIAYAGNHGLELDRGRGETIHPVVESHRDRLREVIGTIEAGVADIEGAFVEDKRATASVHYRLTDDGAAVVAEVVETAVEAIDGIEVTHGDAVFELRPAVGWDKGDAARTVADASTNPMVCYLGDDRTDLDAKQMLRSMDRPGVFVAVGDAIAEQGYHLDDPAAVADLLWWLAETVDAYPVGSR